MPKRKVLKDDDTRWTSELTPAPGDLRMVQAFLNTANLGRQQDDLTSPLALTSWLELWGLPTPGAELDDGDLKRAIETRAILRSLVAANHDIAVSAKAMEDLDRVSSLIRVRFGAKGRAHIVAAAEGIDGALARLCAIVASAQFEGIWSQLGICVLKTCRAVFFARDTRKKYCSRRCSSRKSSLTYRHRNIERIRLRDRGNSLVARLIP